MPSNVKGHRGFLGLTDYYRKFLKDYGLFNKPLKDILKKGCFSWSTESEQAFQKLKVAMFLYRIFLSSLWKQVHILQVWGLS